MEQKQKEPIIVELKESENDNKVNIENTLKETVRQIKFTAGVFVLLSFTLVGVIDTILITMLLVVSYLIGTGLSKGMSKFTFKQELDKIEQNIIKTEKMKGLKEDIKDDTEEFKKWLKRITSHDYDYFSNIKRPKQQKEDVNLTEEQIKKNKDKIISSEDEILY